MNCKIALLFFLFVFAGHAHAQVNISPILYGDHDAKVKTKTKHKDHKVHWSLEYEQGLFLLPVFGMQSYTPYKINNSEFAFHDVHTYSSPPIFYCPQPGQPIFQWGGDPTDQANSYLIHITPWSKKWNNRKKWSVIFLVVHDKMQTNTTNNAQPIFRYNNGGREFPLLFNYTILDLENLLGKLSLRHHDKANGEADKTIGDIIGSKGKIIMRLSVMAGPYVCRDDLYVKLPINGYDSVVSTHSGRQWSGYGFMANLNGELGLNISKHFDITLGYKVQATYVHNNTGVAMDGKSLGTISNNMYSIFISPSLNLFYKFNIH